MKSKELFMLIDQIDRRFVEEAWEGDEESGNVIEVVLERSPFHAIKFAAAVAACIVLFGAGLFTIANIRTSDPFLPDNSGAADSPGAVSSIESEVSSDASSKIDVSSKIDDISESIDVSTDSLDVTDKPLDEFTKQGKYNLAVTVPYGDTTFYDPAEKPDNEKYAVIYVDDTNATEEHPLTVCILTLESELVISEKLYITGRGKYGLYYTEPCEAGQMCALWFDNDFKEIYDGSSEIKIVGSWTP